MFKKTLAVVGLAGALILGGSSAALADDYPPDVTCSANPASITVGGTSTITCTGLGELSTITLEVTTSGATLSSVVAAGAGSSVDKPVTDGTATASFTSSTAGSYTVNAVSDGQVLATTAVTVTAATGGLPVTGGTIPAAAIWAGVGAVGIGAIAVTAAVARRRAAQR